MRLVLRGVTLVVTGCVAWQLGGYPRGGIHQQHRNARLVKRWGSEDQHQDIAVVPVISEEQSVLLLPGASTTEPLTTNSVRWVSEDAWVHDYGDEECEDEELGRPLSHEMELPLLVVDAPLLPSGSHSIQVTDKNLEEMYDEILMSGSRRFVATMGDKSDDRRLARNVVLSSFNGDIEYPSLEEDEEDELDAPCDVAEIGCVLYLTDVKDTPGGSRTCEHSVQRDRVRITKVIRREGRLYCRATVVLEEQKSEDDLFTPSHNRRRRRGDEKDAEEGGEAPPPTTFAGTCWARFELLHGIFTTSARNFLRTSASSSDDKSNGRRRKKRSTRPDEPEHERVVIQELIEISKLQAKLDEDVCFREDAIAALGAGPGTGIGSLWHLANSCWLSYLKARASTRARRIYAELHERLVDFLARTGRLPPEFFSSNSAIIVADHNRPELDLSMSELPAQLQRDLLRLKARVADELEPIIGQHKTAQLLLQAPNHEARCHVFANILRSEKHRLQARSSLRDLFPKQQQ